LSINIYKALDELEKLVEGSRRFLGRRWVDERDVFDSLHQLRASLPSEVRKAEEITRESDKILRAAQEEKERILREAKEQGERIIERARHEAERLASESEIVREAEKRANEMLRRAEELAESQKRESQDYVRSMLDRLERIADRIKAVVEEARREMG